MWFARISGALAALLSSSINAQTVTTVVERMEASGDVSIDSKGTVFVADFGATLNEAGGPGVYRLEPDGSLTLFSSGFAGASGNEFGSDGNLYQSDVARGEAYRIAPDGSRTLIASGLSSPVGIAPAPDGTVYVTQCTSNEISRIGPDKSVTAVAKGAPLNCPNGLSFGPNGKLYAANFRDGKIVEISVPDGKMTVFANIPGESNGHLAWANNRFYVASFRGRILYELGADGTICPLAGTGEIGNSDGPAANASFFRPNGLAVTPDGNSLYTNTVIASDGKPNPDLHPNALRRLDGLLGRPECKKGAGAERG